MPRKYRAFTLIELLVVLGILTFLLTVVPPLLPQVREDMQVKSAARELAAGLRESRGLAIRGARDVPFTVNLKERWFSIGHHRHSFVVPGDAKLEMTLAKSERTSASQGAIRFYPDGSSTGGRITLSGGKRSYRIDVEWLTGEVAVTP